MDSASGGIFSVLAEEILENDGIVFGAQFKEDFSVFHSGINTIDKLALLRGSKYLESKIGDTFRECKNHLNNGKAVLFSGTPCQIAGLKAYLQKDYDNLYCVDLVCRGIPSPSVWKSYLNYQEDINKLKPEKIIFREKSHGWKQVTLLLQYENNRQYFGSFDKDLFYQTMHNNICFRPSCYQCKFKALKHQSDITIGDFWGIDKCYPEMFDDKGTSIILIHSDKGKELFDNKINKFKFMPVNIELALNYNSMLTYSTGRGTIPGKRVLFFKYLDVLPFDTLVRKYVYDSDIIKIYRFVRKCLGKIKRIVRNIYHALFKDKP
jgi:coenzyme F420-reducing hydrogenase beta subunit